MQCAQKEKHGVAWRMADSGWSELKPHSCWLRRSGTDCCTFVYQATASFFRSYTTTIKSTTDCCCTTVYTFLYNKYCTCTLYFVQKYDSDLFLNRESLVSTSSSSVFRRTVCHRRFFIFCLRVIFWRFRTLRGSHVSGSWPSDAAQGRRSRCRSSRPPAGSDSLFD